MDLTDLLYRNLPYRCEGNASICFDMIHTDLVLKLLKEDDRAFEDDQRQKDLVDYNKNVIKHWISEKYLCNDIELIGPLRRDMIVDLMKEIEPDRPDHRRRKSVNPEDCHGLIVGH